MTITLELAIKLFSYQRRTNAWCGSWCRASICSFEMIIELRNHAKYIKITTKSNVNWISIHKSVFYFALTFSSTVFNKSQFSFHCSIVCHEALQLYSCVCVDCSIQIGTFAACAILLVNPQVGTSLDQHANQHQNSLKQPTRVNAKIPQSLQFTFVIIFVSRQWFGEEWLFSQPLEHFQLINNFDTM